MNTRPTLASILIGLAVVVSIGGFVFWQNNSSSAPATTPSENIATTTAETPAPAQSGITSAQVATHNSRSSCWSTINGNVYDLTSWIPQHPGGEQAILQLCGTDGSAKFNGKHGGAPKQELLLAGFKIGIVAQ